MPRKERPSRLDKALQERMYFISHIAPSTEAPSHRFLITGQSGNVYTVTLPTTEENRAHCNCTDQRIRRSLCKHMLFTLLRVLKIPRDTLPTTDADTIPLLTTSLLATVETAAKRIKCADVEAPDRVRNVVTSVAPGVMGVRGESKKREVKDGDECPICYEELQGEALVYCSFGCGNAVHQECFERYRRATEDPVRCVLCRSVWERKEELGKRGFLVGRRLVNVAEVVPDAFPRGKRAKVRRLGLDKGNGYGSSNGSNGKGLKGGSSSGGSSSRTGARKNGVAERIAKNGPSDRDLRMRAREERRRLAQRNGRVNGKGNMSGAGSGRQTRSRSNGM